MNELDLFAAIGQIDDNLLLPAPKIRPLRRGWLIAAVLTVLLITACAPVILGAIQTGDLQYVGEFFSEFQRFDNQGNANSTLKYSESEYTIEIEIEAAENIPAAIETVYLPIELPDAWENQEVTINSVKNTLFCKWDILSEPGYRAAVYQQWPLDPEDKSIQVFADPGATVETCLHTIGKISVLEIASPANPQVVQEKGMEHPVVFTTGGKRDFYWSDGVYLFRLYVPYELEFEAVEHVISSLAPADSAEIPIVDP
ncbi:MAG: hypothetical protein IKJ99_06310 [Oscillospiraceae bacterium]|nr:hypothetical protein [Oscillospiraceae bacterium]